MIRVSSTFLDFRESVLNFVLHSWFSSCRLVFLSKIGFSLSFRELFFQVQLFVFTFLSCEKWARNLVKMAESLEGKMVHDTDFATQQITSLEAKCCNNGNVSSTKEMEEQNDETLDHSNQAHAGKPPRNLSTMRHSCSSAWLAESVGRNFFASFLSFGINMLINPSPKLFFSKSCQLRTLYFMFSFRFYLFWDLVEKMRFCFLRQI